LWISCTRVAQQAVPQVHNKQVVAYNNFNKAVEDYKTHYATLSCNEH